MNNEVQESLAMNVSPQKSMKFKTPFSQIMKLVLVLMVFCTSSLVAQVQQTQVIVEYGAPEGLASLIQGSSEDYLEAINRWQQDGTDIFPDEPGTEVLKGIVEKYNLVSTIDTLGTGLLFFEDEIELPRIFLQPKGGNQYSYQELILTFAITGELTNARLGDQNYNFDRILSRNISVDDEETRNRLDDFLSFYEVVFNNKSLDSLKSLFSEEALIISGRKAGYFDGFEFLRNTVSGYVDRMGNGVFVSSNSVEVVLEDHHFYRHPDIDGVYGVMARQQWNTTAYSDVGYIFFIVDLNGESPKIMARKWQPNPFQIFRFSNPEPDPLITAITLKDVTVGSFSELHEGTVEISVNAPNNEVLNAYLLEEWLNNGTLNFGDINMEPSSLEVLDSTHLSFDFEVLAEGAAQKIISNIKLQETSYLKGFDQPLELYLSRVNKLALMAYEEGEEPDQHQSTLDFMAALAVETNTDSVQIKLTTLQDQLLRDLFQPTNTSYFELVAGDYQLHFQKDGFHDFQKNVSLLAGADTTLLVQLEEIPRDPVVVLEQPVQEIPVESKKSFFSKNKYWLIGGAAAVLTSTVLIISNAGGDQGPGIPVPPGRPGIN